MINRIIEFPDKQSFFLFGPRQTGKSTLIRERIKGNNVLYYDLLKTDEYMRLFSNPHLFRDEVLTAKYCTHVVVDEIQRVPNLLNEIHFLLEESTNNAQFIVSGSSARKLKREKANMLAGRLITKNFYPLTHLELGDLFDLNKCLEVGTLPKIYLEYNREHANDYLRSYVETYLKEEIEAKAILRNTAPFFRFVFQAGYESGNILNYSSISRDTGTSYVTVKEYFKILEDTLIGSFLFPFNRSKRKRLSMHPKFYLFDTGIVRALSRKLTLRIEPKTSEYGNLFEHWIINETMRLSSYWKKDFLFSYYRTEKGAEVDLIIETPNNIIVAVEIKSSDNPHSLEFKKGFNAISEDIKNIKKICVCNAPKARRHEDIEILPWKAFFQYLKAL